MRLKLLQLGDREWMLSVVLHHLICDRWSVGVLVRELSALYNAFLHGQPSPLDDLPVQYGDYALWQRHWLQGEALDRQLAYWRQQFKDAPPVLDFPGDRPRPAVQTYRGAREPIALSESLSQALKRLCVEAGATPYMGLLSAFNVLLYRYTNQTDIVVGTDIANRDRRDIEGAIGLFFNTLVLRTDLSGNPTFRELLARVREVALGAYSHQDLPFEKLVEALNPERSLSRMPLYQVKFDLQQAPVRSLDLSGLTVTPFPVENGTTKFDLRFNLQDTADGIAGEVEYSTDLFDATTIRRIVAHFQTLLARVADNPDRPLSALSLLTPAEREQQQQWNRTAADYPRHRCVHQLWSDRAPDAAITPENLAYIIYTSGSTGQPKGVEIPHRTLTNFLCALGDQLDIGDRDVWLAVTTIAFDIAALELYLPLLAGGRLVIADRATATDGPRLARALDACGATIMQATPATWTMLLASGWRGRDNLVALCGGEALNGTVAAQLQQRCAALWNLYGPTETTIWSAAYRVESANDGIVPIGYPIANTQIYLLDGDLQPVPVGVPGEIYIGGGGLARGYRHRPHLSADKFIANPHSSDPGARLYKTGDLARYRRDGAIAFLGRLDRQVKRRGYRIELGEIEAAFIQHPDIAEAAVVMGEDQQLVAYLVATNDTVPSAAQVRQFLRQTLPDYMVSDRVVTLDALPRTPNGKLDRRSLPAPDRHRASDREFVAPRTPTEAAIADIWAQVLNLEAIGIGDNFFELGGHSLSATQVSARVRERFGVELPLQAFFADPTVAHLADCLDRCQTAPSPTPTDDREELEL
jgi:amino acid adenylation domain-containing protein